MGSISKYDDPLAEGIRPVFKTVDDTISKADDTYESIRFLLNSFNLHIFRSSVDFLARCGLSAVSPAAERSNEAYTGALVPL